MASSSTIPEPSPPAEPHAGSRTVVIFLGNTEYLVGGGKLKAIQVRRVGDGQEMASLEAGGVTCLAVSKDGSRIAAGTANGDVLVWDSKTYERVFKHKEPLPINGVNFCHKDSTLFVSHNRTATDWDITSGHRIRTCDHEAKQTPTWSWPRHCAHGGTTENSFRMYDQHDGSLFFELPTRATFSRSRWLRGNNFVVISGDTIKVFSGLRFSKVVEWTVPYSEHSRIAIPKHDEFIAYCANHTVTFWDASTHTRSGLIERPLEVSSIAFSENGQLLAIGGLDGEVVIQDLKDGLLSDYSTAPCIHLSVCEGTMVDSQVSLTSTISTSHYQSNHISAIMSLARVLIKRSKMYVADGLWELALNDANKVIELDPLSPWGYERKHAALHKAGDYDNAFNAFETMLSKMSQSSSPSIRGLHRHYVNPTDTRAAIRRVVQDAIRDSPPMLIDTASGRLLDKSEQAASFKSQPVFKKLLSSMTTIIDHTRIEHDVKQYYRYAMLSHTWQDNEPLFEKVIRIIVYDLEDSPANGKLKMFCKIAQDAGFHWAWSDTCCINRKNESVLQETLVAIFRWYQGSALTLVLLCDVHSPSQRGDLIKSVWNTRAWAFQEYHASKVVRFYNGDWTLYRNIEEPNHKESPEILSEMEEATGISIGALKALQPGLDNIRQKLSLVSRRGTTLVEDEAYSLLGIFTTSLPVVYGDGDQALGRLLAEILSSSGDASILAWIGESGSFNSCFPGRIRVFSELSTSHIPPPMTDAEMDAITATLEVNLDLIVNFHDRLRELPAPSFSSRRLKLPCLSFKLEPLSASQTSSEQVLYAQAAGLGNVEISTPEHFTQLDSLTLIHPWIDFLLGRRPVEEAIPEGESDDDSDESSSASEPPSLPPPPMDKLTAALRLIARLRQPFGALLLASTGQGVAEYRRVASESLITVQVQDDTLDYLIDCIQTLDVL